MSFLRKPSVTGVIALAAGALLSGCQTAGSLAKVEPAPKFAAAQSRIEALISSGEVKSIAVGVIENGKIRWTETFGFADAESGLSPTVHTPYGIASMGKAVTTTAAMTLVEDGKLDFDANVADILGQEAIRIYAGSRAPTVRELLNMTSGVPHGALTYNDASTANENLIFKNQSVVAFPAGSTFHYSNFSMALVEKVIEKISGEPFDEYIADAVFRPLGMSNARIGVNLPGAAIRYRADGSKYGSIAPFPRSSRQMNASLSDLMNFAAMNLNAAIPGGSSPLTRQSIDIMQNEKSLAAGAHIALGVASFDLGDGERMIISSGNDMGVQSSMFLLSKARAGAIVLANSSGYHSDEIAVSLLDAAVPGTMEKFISIANAFEARTTLFTPTPELAGKWSGNILSGDTSVPVAISIGDDGVLIGLNGAEKVEIDETAMRDGVLSGAFEGFLPLYEKPDGRHRIEVSLIYADDHLYGFVLANFRSTRGKFEIPAAIVMSRSD